MKKYLPTVFLVAAFIILYGLRAVFMPGEKVGEGQVRLLYAKKDKISKIEIIQDQNKVTLEKQNEKWFMTFPHRLAADSSSVESMVDEASNFVAEREVESRPKDLKSFGLEKPKKHISVYAGQKELLKFQVGEQIVLGGGYYVKLADRPSVYTVSSYKVDLFVKTEKELWAKKLFEFERGQILKMDVRYKGKVYATEKQKDQWRLTTPKIKKDMKKPLEDIETFFENLYAEALEDPAPKELKKYGLEPPVALVKLTRPADPKKKQSGQEFIFLLGKKKNGSSYARKKDAPEVFTLSESDVKQLLDSLKALP